MQPDQLYPWQNSNWSRLTKWLDMQRIPHALLLSGPKGYGKSQLAFFFAKTLLCNDGLIDRKPCGVCRSCQLFSARTHPDFVLLEPDQPDKAITIDSIRELRDKLALSPQYGGFRVFLIQPAHQLNSNSANALLKTLEEPSPNTLLILISESPGSLPATILSRCQHLVIARPDFDTAVSWLSGQVEPGEAETLLSLTNGSPMAALQLFEQGELDKRLTIFQSWLNVADKSADPVCVADQWQDLCLSSILFWISGWTVDMIRLHNHPKIHRLNNPDLRDSLQAEAQRLNLIQLFSYFDLLLRVNALLNTQANPQMLLEEILIEWQMLSRKS